MIRLKDMIWFYYNFLSAYITIYLALETKGQYSARIYLGSKY
jgi:hypothetical protein